MPGLVLCSNVVSAISLANQAGYELVAITQTKNNSGLIVNVKRNEVKNTTF